MDGIWGEGLFIPGLTLFANCLVLWCSFVCVCVCSIPFSCGATLTKEKLLPEQALTLTAGTKMRIDFFFAPHFKLLVHRANCPTKSRTLVFIDPTGLDVALDGNEDTGGQSGLK